MCRVRIAPLVSVALLALALPTGARADVTAFIGSTLTPWTARTTGLAVGATMLVVGVEFEYATGPEDSVTETPGLTTAAFNLVVHVPVRVGRLQPYGTVGAEFYRQTLGDLSKTGTGFNVGGGVKISLAGPLRLRLDYRVLTLQDAPVPGRLQRVYAGLNLSF